MAQYGSRGLIYSLRQSGNARPVDGYSSPSYASYREASNMPNMYSPAEQHPHRDRRQNVSMMDKSYYEVDIVAKATVDVALYFIYRRI